MGWFDEQLKYRKQRDNENFADAVESIAGAVMGQSLTDAYDSKSVSKSAIEEIMKYYRCKGKRIEDDPLPESTEEQLDLYFEPYGVMRRNVTLEKGWYKNAAGAMLGTLEDGSKAALIPRRIKGYTYYDYSKGKRIAVNAKTEKLISSEAICFYKPLPLKKLNVVDLFLFIKQQKSLYETLTGYFLLALLTAVGMLAPVLNKWLFGSVLQSGSTDMLLALAGFMVCYSVSSLLISAYKSLVAERTGTKQRIAVQAAVMNRIMNLPASFFKNYTSGELSTRAGYIQSLCSILTDTVGGIGLTSIFSLIYIGQIFSFAPALVVPSLAITVLSTALTLTVTFFQTKVTREKMELYSKTDGMTYSMITGIRKIKLAGAEKRMFSRWAKAYAGEAALEYNPPLLLKLGGTFNLALTLAGSLLLYYLAVKSSVSVSNYYAFNSAFGMVSGAFSALSGVAAGIADIKPTLEMARPIMEAEPENSEGRERIRNIRGSVEFNDVYFRYEEGMPNVIDGLSLKINTGEYVAVVGETGCGKSTLVRLLLGFETPQKGTITVDRKDISRIDPRSLRKNIGVVMQDSKLFQGDIFSNITISAPQLDLKGAWEAAETACIADDIREMPMGMYTYISEGQGGISGGQRQRLMIARAVAGKPKILVFDEATSALDNVTQKNVSKAIDSLKCTRIVIAHRLSTIKHCDRIVYMEKGKIVEDGTYDELIALDGRFAKLVERQRTDEAPKEESK